MGDKCVKTHLFQAELETDDAWRFFRRRGWRRSRIQPIRIGISSKWRCFLTKQSEQKATNVFPLGASIFVWRIFSTPLQGIGSMVAFENTTKSHANMFNHQHR
jgi:hypothetical protein